MLGPGGETCTVAVNQPPQAQGGPTAQPLEAVFDLSAGKYALTVEAGPSFTSRREEAASQMIALIQAFPQAAPVLGDLLAKNLDWPGADEIAERLKLLLPPQLQGGQGAAGAAVAQQVQGLQSQIAALQGARDLQAQKLNIEQFRAATERIEAVQKLQPQGG